MELGTPETSIGYSQFLRNWGTACQADAARCVAAEQTEVLRMFREMRHGAAMPPMRGYGRGYYERYPGEGAGSVLPKVIGVVVAIGLIRMLASHKRGHDGGGSWRDRRRDAIAEIHRELHRQDDSKADATEPKKGTATA